MNRIITTFDKRDEYDIVKAAIKLSGMTKRDFCRTALIGASLQVIELINSIRREDNDYTETVNKEGGGEEVSGNEASDTEEILGTGDRAGPTESGDIRRDPPYAGE
jgi:general stress protein YciG